MCGIVGIRSRSEPVASDSLLAAMRVLRHRGPDGEGHWLAAGGKIGLGHTRLSIIDLDTGAQPIANEDETIRIVVNGEFYGFEAIRCDLEKKGHRFRTRSDAEIALHLYEEYGTACLAHLRGEFAFVLWDGNRNRLFAARDRFGIKPLYYAERDDSLYLASEAKALFAAGVRAGWDDDAVFQIMFACVAQDRSVFRGVRQIPPGHFLLSYDAGGVELQRYWDADYPVAEANGARLTDPRDSLEQVRFLLEESVRLRMRADVPVGCLLSGGLDSSVALGIASSQGARPMNAYTISFDHPDYDESVWARQSADFNGANLEVVSAADAELADNFVESVRHGEIVHYNAHGTARYLLSRAVRRSGYKTVLAGEGADELFAGYGFCRPAVLNGSNGSSGLPRRMRTAWRLLRPATREQAAIGRTSPWLARATRVMDLPGWLVGSLAERMDVLRSVMPVQAACQIREHDPYRGLFDSLNAGERIRGREPAKQLIYLWLKTIFPGYILTADRADMAHGVEVRLPFLDHVLFEHVREIPIRTLAFRGENKYLLREAATQYISEVIRARPKKPLMAPPFSSRPEGKLLGVIQDVLRSKAMSDVPFFATAAITQLADDAHSRNGDGRASADPLLIMAASLCILQEAYGL
jgi:asparagine synthase (glutamine-hydrolysing)